MVIYLIVIFLFIYALRRVDNISDVNYRMRKEDKYFKILASVLVILAATRGILVGTDTMGYVLDYRIVQNNTFKQIIERYDVGTGYFITSKLFSLTGLSVQWWFFVTESFFMYALYGFLSKLSTDKIFCLFCIFTTGLYAFSLAGQKQTMAMSAVFLAFTFFMDRKYLYFALLSVFAFLCHSSSAIFLAAIALYLIHDKKWFNGIVYPVILLLLFSGTWVWNTLIGILDEEHYNMYLKADNTYTLVTLFFYIAIMVVSFFSWKNLKANNLNKQKLLFATSMLVIAFQSYASMFANSFRIAYYFLPFMCVLLTESVSCSKNKVTFRLVSVMMLSIWMLYTNRNLVFTFF